MTTKLRAQILDSLAKVDPTSIMGKCIEGFCKEAHLKTDGEIMQMVGELHDQMGNNPLGMRNVLGDQYRFIQSIKVNARSVVENQS